VVWNLKMCSCLFFREIHVQVVFENFSETWTPSLFEGLVYKVNGNVATVPK
jgi:hypothetical protein